MTYELANNITMTALMFTLLFIAAIKHHGDDEPPFPVKATEVIGLLFSGATFFVFSLVTIWVR